MSVDDEAFSKLMRRVSALEAQVAYLTQQMGASFTPPSQPQLEQNPQIVEQIKKGNLIEAIRIHRETYGSSLSEAKRAVEELRSRLGIR